MWIIALLAGLVLGGVITWLILRPQAATLAERLSTREARLAELTAEITRQAESVATGQTELAAAQHAAARLEVQLAEERKATAEKLAVLNEAQARLSDAFKALSAEALKSNNDAFLRLAHATLEKFQEGARHDLDKRQVAIHELVKPVHETLGKFDAKIGEIEKARVAAYGGLTEQVRGLADLQQHLRQETSNLVRALGSPRVRGRWGELQLRRVVEIAGMLEHCDFQEQQQVATEDGALRPDLIVRLPGGKSIVVDAKTPMEAYLQAIEAPDEITRRAKLADHARNVRDHMRTLGTKAYWKQFQPAPDFIVLFVPGESFFSAALEHDPELIDRQIDENRVIPASPTTLIALLKAAAYGWRQEALTENAAKISELGRELYERIAKMTEHLAKVGGGLKRAVESYNDAMNSMDKRVLVSARRFRDLKIAHTSEELAAPDQVEVMPRAVDAGPPDSPSLPGVE
jgi:DNA recombination protein RmuC